MDGAKAGARNAEAIASLTFEMTLAVVIVLVRICEATNRLGLQGWERAVVDADSSPYGNG